ncbi:MAG TPA: aminodeoxychorismate synthase component I [Nocardioidaceae bacterium]|nr:aminodeoxychorismate synthase component I [Nocardioidaceae bacterium]
MTRRGWDWVEPEDFFVAHVAGRDRSWWLDGGGARAWSGRMTYIGWLRPSDLSVTYSVATGVAAHGSGSAVAGHRPPPSHADVSSDLPAATDIFGWLAEFGRRRGGRALGRGEGRTSGWVGFFGYAARSDLPTRQSAEPTYDACWLRAQRRVAFDHERRRVYAVAPPEQLTEWEDELDGLLAVTPRAATLGAMPPAEVVSTCSASEYSGAFHAVQEHLRLGNSYEVNLTYRTEVASQADPVDVYRRLRASSPAPYAALISHGGMRLLSSSPERFATISAHGEIETRPIKGTTPRSQDAACDEDAVRRLQHDPRYRAENLMIVDLLRNDLSRVCSPGTVAVTDLMHVESYPSVHQLVSTVSGRLRPEVSTMEALEALFPGGSMTGAPKLRTMQIIADVESSARGVYSGAVGWILDDSSADLGIVIRSLVYRDGVYTLGTGGGITVRSTCSDEYDETRWKAQRLLAALGVGSA